MEAAPGHEEGCQGLMEGHIERVPDADGRGHLWRALARCRCYRRIIRGRALYRRLAEAEAALKRRP